MKQGLIQSSNKNDIMKHCIMKNIWEDHAIHFLEEPQIHVLPFFNLILSTMSWSFLVFLLNYTWLSMAFGFVVGQVDHF